MKKVFIGVFFLFVSRLSQTQTVDEIIAKNVAATGGAAWGKLKTMKMDISMTSPVAPGRVMYSSITVIHEKAFRMDVTLMGTTLITCLNGDKGWRINPFAGKMDTVTLSADEVKEIKYLADITGLYGYKEKGYTAEYLGKEDVEGKNLHKIKLIVSPTHIQYSFIDPETFFVIKQISVDLPDGQEVTSETRMSDFKIVEGLTIAHNIEDNHPIPDQTVMKITSLVINPAVDETIFEMPVRK